LNGGTSGLGGLSQNNAFGANSNSSFGQNSAANNAQNESDPSQTGAQGSSRGTSPSTPGDTTGGAGDASGANTSGTGNGTSGSSPFASGQIIGGPIVGVASTVKDKTIREFNHKNKYKDWVFVYDPAQDQGRLIMTPYQPQVPGFGQPGMQNINGQVNGQINGGQINGGQINGQPGNTGFGTSQPPGMQNTPTTPVGGPGGAPNPPNNPPEQQ
jgi:hypothetical protein